MIHETVDQDIKKILIERDIMTLKQAFCKIMWAEIRNNGTRVFVPDKLFLQNRLQNDLADKELQLGRQLLESGDYNVYNRMINLVIRELVSDGTITKQKEATQRERELLYFQVVSLSLLYAQKVLDHNHDGLISIQQIAKDPVLSQLLVPSSVIITSFLTNNTKVISDALVNKFSNNTSIAGNMISIDKQLKPELVKYFESFSVVTPGEKCMSQVSCPIWFNSYNALEPNSNIIGNVPPATSILILQGENDSQTPLQNVGLFGTEHTL